MLVHININININGCGIEFDARSDFSVNGDYSRNVIIFGMDNILATHIDDARKWNATKNKRLCNKTISILFRKYVRKYQLDFSNVCTAFLLGVTPLISVILKIATNSDEKTQYRVNSLDN